MGQVFQCDGCGKDIGEMDRVYVRSDSLDDGAIMLDLCTDCAAPIREIPTFKEHLKKNREKIKANIAASTFDPGTKPPTRP